MKCTNRFPSFGHFERVSGLFRAKKRLCRGRKCTILEKHPPIWRHRPEAPPQGGGVEFWAQILTLAKPPPKGSVA